LFLNRLNSSSPSALPADLAAHLTDQAPVAATDPAAAAVAAGRPIALVGMPGSGKSTVGKLLARRLGLPFADSDHVLEQRMGCPIRTYFEQQGEERFRDLEQSVIAELSAIPGVLATGGGAVLREANRRQLHGQTFVIYLRSSPDQVFQRVRHDRKRPLLQVDDPLARLKALHAERDPLYRETAHLTMDTGRPSLQTLVNMIVMQLEQSGLSGDSA
jgi:shikimate kinase